MKKIHPGGYPGKMCSGCLNTVISKDSILCKTCSLDPAKFATASGKIERAIQDRRLVGETRL